MKVKGILYIIIGVIALISPILAFKSITIEYGNSTETVLIGFRILFILGGLSVLALTNILVGIVQGIVLP